MDRPIQKLAKMKRMKPGSATQPVTNGVTNGAPALSAPNASVTDASTEYSFTPDEVTIIRPSMQEAQSKLDALNGLVRLIVSQQKLPGNWQLKGDGSGLIRQP